MIRALKSALPTRRAPPAAGIPVGETAAPPAARGGFGGRFAVILSGELIQSLFHFALNIALVRILSQHDYGLFAIVFTGGAVGLAYIRALVAVPATLHIARSLGRPAERGYDVVFGSGALALCLGMAALALALLIPVMGVAGALGAGAFVALYAFRSYLRLVLLARKSARIAGMSDGVYAGVGLTLTLAILYAGDASALDHAFLALAFAHACGIVVSYVALRQPLRITLRRSLWRRYVGLWRTLLWSLTGVTSMIVQGQGLTLAFAAIVGPAAYAPIAATLVLFAPLRIPTNALVNMVLAEVTGLLATGQARQADRIVVRSTAVIALGCLVYGAAMWFALPLIEQVLFKGRFGQEPMAWIGLGIWAVTTISLLYAIPRTYLEASAAFRSIAWGAVGAALLGFSIMIPMLLSLPSHTALLGLIASELASCLWYVLNFRRLARRADGAVLAAAALVSEAEAPREGDPAAPARTGLRNGRAPVRT